MVGANHAVKIPARPADIENVSAPSTCPQCATALRPDAAWCPLCFTSIAAEFDPLTAPLEEVVGGNGTTLTQEMPPAVETGLSTSRVPEPHHESVPVSEVGHIGEEALAADVAEPAPELSDTDVMLAMLAAEHRQDDPTSKYVERLGDKSARMVVMIGGMVVVTVVVFAFIVVLGAVT